MESIPGRVLAAARVMAGMTMTDLSESCGASTRTLVKLEGKLLIQVGEYGESGKHREDTLARVLAALREEGVEITENGRGARLRDWPR